MDERIHAVSPPATSSIITADSSALFKGMGGPSLWLLCRCLACVPGTNVVGQPTPAELPPAPVPAFLPRGRLPAALSYAAQPFTSRQQAVRPVLFRVAGARGTWGRTLP